VEVGATCDRRRCNGIGGALDGSVRFWALCLRTILSLVVYILHRNGILRGCLETLTAIVYLRCGPCEPIPIEVGEEEMRGEKSLERCEEDGRGEIQRYVRDEGSDYCCYRAGFTRISVLERKRPVSRIFEGPGNAVESTSRRFRVL